jgi:hypothetical protein
MLTDRFQLATCDVVDSVPEHYRCDGIDRRGNVFSIDISQGDNKRVVTARWHSADGNITGEHSETTYYVSTMQYYTIAMTVTLGFTAALAVSNRNRISKKTTSCSLPTPA